MQQDDALFAGAVRWCYALDACVLHAYQRMHRMCSARSNWPLRGIVLPAGAHCLRICSADWTASPQRPAMQLLRLLLLAHRPQGPILWRTIWTSSQEQQVHRRCRSACCTEAAVLRASPCQITFKPSRQSAVADWKQVALMYSVIDGLEAVALRSTARSTLQVWG